MQNRQELIIEDAAASAAALVRVLLYLHEGVSDNDRPIVEDTKIPLLYLLRDQVQAIGTALEAPAVMRAANDRGGR